MLENPEDFGREIAKRTRLIAAEVADSIRKDALERLSEALDLNTATAQLVSDLKDALEESDLPRVLELLQAQRSYSASAEATSLQRETALLERDQRVRDLLDELQELKDEALSLRETITAKSLDLDQWQATTAASLGDAREDVTRATETAAAVLKAIASDVTDHKDNLAATLTLGMDLWQREIDTAVSKAEEAVLQANGSRETLADERRSLAASRAHVTKALDALAARSADLFADISAKAEAHIAKIEAPPQEQTSTINPAMRWRGPYSESTRYRAGDLVMFSGSTWIAIKSSTGKAPAVAYGNPWELFAAAGAGGFTRAATRLGVNNPPPAFYQDTAPPLTQPNWFSPDGSVQAFVRQWFRTTDLKQHIAIPDAGDTFVWAEVI